MKNQVNSQKLSEKNKKLLGRTKTMHAHIKSTVKKKQAKRDSRNAN